MLVSDNIFPMGENGPQSDKNLDKQRELQDKSFKYFKEILVEENILYLQTLVGYKLPEESEPEIVKQNALEFECIDSKKLNCLHWVICARRDDLFNYVIESYFKQAMNTKDCLE